MYCIIATVVVSAAKYKSVNIYFGYSSKYMYNSAGKTGKYLQVNNYSKRNL